MNVKSMHMISRYTTLFIYLLYLFFVTSLNTVFQEIHYKIYLKTYNKTKLTPYH